MLVESGARVVAVEVDHGLCELLRGRFSSAPRLTLIEGDALAAKHRLNAQVVAALASLQPGAAGARKLVANLPYQIATPLLINLLYAEPPLERLCCTIQREVGDRLTAAAGSDAYGPVSVLVQGMARVRRIAHVPPEAFWPRPEVESIMLRITPEPAPDVSAAEAEGLSRLVHRGFAQRRKKLRTSIRDAGLPSTSVDAALEAAGISRDARPEALSPAEWLTFHRALARFRPAAAGGATPRS
jgi:16S rRNA (adenine1518-N6/adenine1519-N6)-dimethyltransferase